MEIEYLTISEPLKVAPRKHHQDTYKRIELPTCEKCGRFPVLRSMLLDEQLAFYYQCGCKTSKRYIVHGKGDTEYPEKAGSAIRKAAISWMSK